MKRKATAEKSDTTLLAKKEQYFKKYAKQGTCSSIVLLDSIVLWHYSEAAYNLFSWGKSIITNPS